MEASSPPPAASATSGRAPSARLGGCLKWGCGIALGLALLALVSVWVWWRADVAGPFPGYEVRLDRLAPAGDRFLAGAAAIDITPAVPEKWTDEDGDGEYEPEDGESFEDADGDGVFDAVWMAGYGNGRPATGVHDPLWARALVVEVNDFRVGIVICDLVGLFHDEVIRVRKRIDEEAAEGGEGARPLVDYLMVASTHGHEGPDTMGLWGGDDTSSGVDPAYMQKVRDGIHEAVKKAAAELRPARASYHETKYGDKVVMYDHERKPYVVDDTLGVIHFTEPGSGDTIATFVSWSDHPETMGDVQTLITSDFPHWLREGVEKGVGLGGKRPVEGLGGVCIFANGSVGGMMTSLRIDLPDRETGELIPEEGWPWSRPQSVGEHVAEKVLELVRKGDAVPVTTPRLHVRARTMRVPVDNTLFKLGAKLGRLDRGSYDGGQLRSEVAIIDLGPARLVGVPGEIYPEIVVGGIEAPEGRDFEIDPLEVPPLKEALAEPGVEHIWVIGLANDEVGYLIPKSEWDAPRLPWDSDGNPPYLYGADEPPYGEINSCGPDAAKAVYDALLRLVKPRG